MISTAAAETSVDIVEMISAVARAGGADSRGGLSRYKARTSEGVRKEISLSLSLSRIDFGRSGKVMDNSAIFSSWSQFGSVMVGLK